MKNDARFRKVGRNAESARFYIHVASDLSRNLERDCLVLDRRKAYSI